MGPTTGAERRNVGSPARVACARAGIATAERRLIGYQRLRCTISPYARARPAIAIPPTRPPLTPAEYGWTSTGTRVRCPPAPMRSEEHTSELQSLAYLVCRLLLEKKKKR